MMSVSVGIVRLSEVSGGIDGVLGDMELILCRFLWELGVASLP
jgi:hypothetical protein